MTEDKLTKLKILAFKNPDCCDKLGEIEVLVKSTEGISTFEMKMYFDGTGIISQEVVDNQILKVKNLLYKFDGEIHEPNYLKVYSGIGLLFMGILNSWVVNYTSFKTDGSPLRAEVAIVLVRT